MKIAQGLVDHDDPTIVAGLRRAVKNVKGSGDHKTNEIARIIGVPHELVRKYEEDARRRGR
jgi:hypothetical protein